MQCCCNRTACWQQSKETAWSQVFPLDVHDCVEFKVVQVGVMAFTGNSN